MNRKITPFTKICALVAISLIALGLVAPAFAAEHLLQSFPELNDVQPGVQLQDRGWGVSVTGNGEYLSRFVVYAYNSTATTSTSVRAYLYNASGNLPATPYNPIDVSDPVTINPTAPITAYEFDFGSDVDLVDGESYFVAVNYNSTTTGIARYNRGMGNGGYLIAQNGYGDAWTSSSYELIHYIYTDDEVGGGAPYTPPGTADTTSWDNLISSFTSFIVPIIVILLPALLLMFLTRRADKWLLIIGLVIGAGLGYYFNLVPLWLVFLITIGVIGMAYQSVRGGGDS